MHRCYLPSKCAFLAARSAQIVFHRDKLSYAPFCQPRYSRNGIRTLHHSAKASSGGDPQGAENPSLSWTNKDITEFLETMYSKNEEQIARYKQTMKELQELKDEPGNTYLGATQWIKSQMQQMQESQLVELQEFSGEIKAALSKAKSLPDDTSFESTMDTLLEEDTTRDFVINFMAGPSALGVMGGRVLGAWIFAWLAGFAGAQPYLLWQEPWDEAWLTFGLWTAPYLALMALVTLVRKTPVEQAVRPLSCRDEQATAALAAEHMRFPQRFVYALAASTAAGIVFRGVWLNSIRGNYFLPQPSSILEPDLTESLLRNSFGSLVPSVTLPTPAIVLLFGAAATTALLETVCRIPSATFAQLSEDVEDPFSSPAADFARSLKKRQDASTEETTQASDAKWSETAASSVVKDQGPFTVAVDAKLTIGEQYEDGDKEERVVSGTIKLADVALEFTTVLYLGLETLVTESLWTSIGTQTLGILVTLYIAKQLQPDDDGAKNGAT